MTNILLPIKFQSNFEDRGQTEIHKEQEGHVKYKFM